MVAHPRIGLHGRRASSGPVLSSSQLLSPRAGQASQPVIFGVTKAEERPKPYRLHGGLESWGGERQGRREETDPSSEGMLRKGAQSVSQNPLD